MSDPVNSPQHYLSGPCCEYCGNTIECITVAEQHGFNIGNALKYLWRADHKGSAIEDLRKAAWYVQRAISQREGAL